MGVSHRRLLVTTASCIALGLATTVAVAWGAAVLLRLRTVDVYAAGVTHRSSPGWLIQAYRKPGAQYVIAYGLARGSEEQWPTRFKDDLLDAAEVDWPAFHLEPPGGGVSGEKLVTARGWPWLALWCETPIAGAGGPPPAMRTVEGGFALPPRQPSNEWIFVDSALRMVPLRPLWHGLLLDTGLYAALWGIIAIARRRARRAVPCFGRRGLWLAPAACIALGMLTTVAVVAGCVLWVDERAEPYTASDGWGSSTYRESDHWSVSRDAEPGALRLRSTVIRAPMWQSGPAPSGPAEQFVPAWADYLVPTEPPTQPHTARHLDARGWPMLAAWGGFEVHHRLKGITFVEDFGSSTNAVVLPQYIDGEFRASLARVIPLAPIWRGFAVNTLFYAGLWAVLGLLFLGPGIVRRTARHLTGRCIHCGYPVGRSDVCTECGLDSRRPMMRRIRGERTWHSGVASGPSG